VVRQANAVSLTSIKGSFSSLSCVYVCSVDHGLSETINEIIDCVTKKDGHRL